MEFNMLCVIMAVIGLIVGAVAMKVLEENRRARDFYEKAGFFSAGNFMEDEIGGRPLREVLYRRNGL